MSIYICTIFRCTYTYIYIVYIYTYAYMYIYLNSMYF